MPSPPSDPPSENFVLPPSMRADESRTGRLAADMARRWRRGERVPAEAYLAQHPDLWDQPEAAADLIYEEICLREEQGEAAAPAEVLARFPQWRAQLEVLLECHRMLEPDRSAPRFPEVGETWEGFRLLAALGRGAQGRVFLATQQALADRPVVLKMTARRGEEHRSLARLQHTHIVPLYEVHDDPSRNLRVLCMPYFGGLTLAQLAQELRAVPPERRQGRDLVAALGRAEAAAPLRCRARGPALRQLERFSYVQAVCWLGACLADGLAYAHERDLLHLDLKPSNVLLAADGQPMLLDFHLAHEPIRPDGPPPEWLGGTPGFMSPEQAAAVAALCEGRPVPAAVDGRSDAYSLGLLLYELLGGEVPLPAGTVPPLDRRNREVSPGLARAVARCLRPDPAERYATALDLGADLHRHLKDLPLVGVAEGAAERWRKWRRRRPRALIEYAGSALLVGALTGAGWFVRQQVTRLSSNLEAQHELADQARDLTRVAEVARSLHPLADRLRRLGDFRSLPAELAGPLDRECETVWEQRGPILDWVRRGATTLREEEARRDLLDLALLWSALQAEREPGPAGRREALHILGEAEALLGPGAALCREEQRHYEALGDTRAACAAGCRAEELPARTAWEHIALGRSLLMAGDPAGGDREFRQAIAQDPRNPWAYFYRAKGREQQVGSLCRRAKEEAAARRDAEALRDYGEALRLDDDLAEGYLNRGVLYYRQGYYREALADLRRALDRGAPAGVAHYDAALAYRALGQDAEAVAELEAALRADPGHKEARALLQALRPRR